MNKIIAFPKPKPTLLCLQTNDPGLADSLLTHLESLPLRRYSSLVEVDLPNSHAYRDLTISAELVCDEVTQAECLRAGLTSQDSVEGEIFRSTTLTRTTSLTKDGAVSILVEPELIDLIRSQGLGRLKRYGIAFQASRPKALRELCIRVFKR